MRTDRGVQPRTGGRDPATGADWLSPQRDPGHAMRGRGLSRRVSLGCAAARKDQGDSPSTRRPVHSRTEAGEWERFRIPVAVRHDMRTVSGPCAPCKPASTDVGRSLSSLAQVSRAIVTFAQSARWRLKNVACRQKLLGIGFGCHPYPPLAHLEGEEKSMQDDQPEARPPLHAD